MKPTSSTHQISLFSFIKETGILQKKRAALIGQVLKKLRNRVILENCPPFALGSQVFDLIGLEANSETARLRSVATNLVGVVGRSVSTVPYSGTDASRWRVVVWGQALDPT